MRIREFLNSRSDAIIIIIIIIIFWIREKYAIMGGMNSRFCNMLIHML